MGRDFHYCFVDKEVAENHYKNHTYNCDCFDFNVERIWIPELRNNKYVESGLFTKGQLKEEYNSVLSTFTNVFCLADLYDLEKDIEDDNNYHIFVDYLDTYKKILKKDFDYIYIEFH